MKFNNVLLPAKIAPPLSLAELLKKMLGPLKVNATLSTVPITPPTSAELWVKLLVPLKLNIVNYLLKI